MCNQPLFALYFSVGEILWGLYSPFHNLSLYSFHLSIPFTSFSLYLSCLSLSLYISLLLPFFLSLFSLSFSLAYIMEVFVLVIYTVSLSWLCDSLTLRWRYELSLRFLRTKYLNAFLHTKYIYNLGFLSLNFLIITRNSRLEICVFLERNANLKNLGAH